MKKYVFTVKEDICTANGKDVTATNLLEKMKLYGTVEDYDTVVASVKAEYQLSLDNVKKQYQAIVDQKLTDDELKLVVAYRERKEETNKVYAEKITSLEKQLTDIKTESEKRIEKIRAAIEG